MAKQQWNHEQKSQNHYHWIISWIEDTKCVPDLPKRTSDASCILKCRHNRKSALTHKYLLRDLILWFQYNIIIITDKHANAESKMFSDIFMHQLRWNCLLSARVFNSGSSKYLKWFTNGQTTEGLLCRSSVNWTEKYIHKKHFYPFIGIKSFPFLRLSFSFTSSVFLFTNVRKISK